MQIVIPMSDFGERFRRAGYQLPKPLIEIDGKAIIAHVIDLFPGETDFIFVCNEDHLRNSDYGMAETLRKYCPSGRIAGIASHKLGPIFAVQQIYDLIDPLRPVIVNYCDFSCFWDWHRFKRVVAGTRCAGAIPAYKGFHPHILGTTNYAYLREEAGMVLDIQEKQPFTSNRMEEYASSGTYYFDSGATMRAAFDQTVARGRSVGGEYYVSLAYKALLDAKRPVMVYPLQHFMQWGTPEDVKEYLGWSHTFRRLAGRAPGEEKAVGSLIVPMAGLGQRFVSEGYSVPKPLIEVSGQAMVKQAVSTMPHALHSAFILREDMPGSVEISSTLGGLDPEPIVIKVPSVTQGQACSALLGLGALEKTAGDLGPVTVAACDNGVIYSREDFARLIENEEIDVVVWGVRGHASAVRHPHMFGWIEEAAGRIAGISVKTPLAAPATDPIVIGTFTFRRAADFRRCVEQLISSNGRINGEFYLDSCINEAIRLGLKCHLFEVDHYISWGTPDELRTFEYWQSCFDKWSSHPYRLEKDATIPADKVSKLRRGDLGKQGAATSSV